MKISTKVKITTIIITLIVSIIFFSFDKNIAGSAFLIVFTLAFIIFLFPIETITEFKFSLNEFFFKTRELKSSIKELKELTKVLAGISLDTIQSQGRWESPNKKKEDNFFIEINQILDTVGILEEERNEIYNKYWHPWIIRDYFSNIQKLIKQIIIKDNKDFYESEYQNIQNHTPAFLREMVKDFYKKEQQIEVDYSEIETYIDDFEYYLQNKQFKDFNRWQKLCGEED